MRVVNSHAVLHLPALFLIGTSPESYLPTRYLANPCNNSLCPWPALPGETMDRTKEGDTHEQRDVYTDTEGDTVRIYGGRNQRRVWSNEASMQSIQVPRGVDVGHSMSLSGPKDWNPTGVNLLSLDLEQPSWVSRVF